MKSPVYTGFARLHKSDGRWRPAQTKEMMVLAISIVAGCDGCIAYHTHNAVEAGAIGQNCWKLLVLG
jgi:AhpD family alkylhydroperoxidase